MREKNNTNLERMRELIERLTEADIAYYKNDAPIMTDLEYDRLTEELASLEHDTGLVLSGSPTQKVSRRDFGKPCGGAAYKAHAVRRQDKVH